MKSFSLVLKVTLGLLAAYSVSQATPNELPDVADFEPQEGYLSGSLDGQQGWKVKRGAAVVVEGSVASGDHSLILAVNDPATRIVKDFTHPVGENIIYVDFFARLAARPFPEISSLGPGEGTWLVLLPEDSSGKLYAVNGNGKGGGEWQSLGVTLPLLPDGRSEEWVRITVRLDYSKGTTDIFIDGELKGMGLGFLGSPNDGFTRLVLEGSELADTTADDLYIGWENPLFE